MKALLTNNDVHKCFHSKRKDVQVLSKEMFEFNKILEGTIENIQKYNLGFSLLNFIYIIL